MVEKTESHVKYNIILCENDSRLKCAHVYDNRKFDSFSDKKPDIFPEIRVSVVCYQNILNIVWL